MMQRQSCYRLKVHVWYSARGGDLTPEGFSAACTHRITEKEYLKGGSNVSLGELV